MWTPAGKTYLLADSHFNHDNIKTYCDRPANFTEVILRNLRTILMPSDTLIHLGDVFIGKVPSWLGDWPGRNILVRGNHDDNHSLSWWMSHGFDFACDSMIYRGQWLTHRPSSFLPAGCTYNIHGHLHNVWHGFHKDAVPGSEEDLAYREKRLFHPWQRLFAVEYTNFRPVEFDKFISQPDKFHARGLRVEIKS